MLNSTGPSAGLWRALLVTGLNFALMMGVSFLVPGSEQQGLGIKKSLDWLLLEANGSLCEQDAETQGVGQCLQCCLTGEEESFQREICVCLVG